MPPKKKKADKESKKAAQKKKERVRTSLAMHGSTRTSRRNLVFSPLTIPLNTHLSLSSLQLIEDKTFGLKNKNKSKKVQQQIKSIEKSVTHSGDPKLRKQEEARKKAKAEAKARKKAQEDERNALFGEALLAVQKKSSTNKKHGKVEAKGRDNDDDEKKSGTSRAMKM